jgi:hypothetical protein
MGSRGWGAAKEGHPAIGGNVARVRTTQSSSDRTPPLEALIMWVPGRKPGPWRGSSAEQADEADGRLRHPQLIGRPLL